MQQVMALLGIILIIISAHFVAEYADYNTKLKNEGLKVFTIRHKTTHTGNEITTDTEVFAYRVEMENGELTCYDKNNNIIGKFNKVLHFGIED